MPSVVPQATLVLAFKGDLDLDTATLKGMLLTSSYVPNPDHKFVSNIVANECSVSGYTGGYGGAGRKTLSSVTIAEDTTNNRCVIDAADPATWVALGAGNTLGFIAIIREFTSDAASPVLAVLEFSSTLLTNGGDVAVQFSADGMFYTQH
jgi:hypothetical protein